jgi:putative flavoprotein involved in K+ transport
VPVVVVGAGPAGPATSRELAVRGIEHLVLEAESIGSSWTRYYRSLVLHTGKHLSHLPGRHSATYLDPGAFRGRRVLVVGVGNSGGEIAAAGVETIASARGGAHVMPLRILGLPSQYWGAVVGALPAPGRERMVRRLAALRRLVSGLPPLPPPERPILARPPYQRRAGLRRTRKIHR